MTDETTLEWTIHLARRRPRQTMAVVAIILLAGAAASYGFRSPLLGVLAVVLLMAGVSDYLFPLRCSLGPDGIAVRGLLHRRRMAWSRVRRVARDDLGVKLSPLARPSRLEAYRGIYLWFADNADQVMAVIAHYRAAEAVGADDHPPV
ncbi:MAG: hypothetical protein JSV79_03720 [Armatimonadota bacterium]|nr:MAG: hypothetical protein JSV79_03720 [Armatimonadota bacterium]